MKLPPVPTPGRSSRESRPKDLRLSLRQAESARSELPETVPERRKKLLQDWVLPVRRADDLRHLLRSRDRRASERQDLPLRNLPEAGHRKAESSVRRQKGSAEQSLRRKREDSVLRNRREGNALPVIAAKLPETAAVPQPDSLQRKRSRHVLPMLSTGPISRRIKRKRHSVPVM